MRRFGIEEPDFRHSDARVVGEEFLCGAFAIGRRKAFDEQFGAPEEVTRYSRLLIWSRNIFNSSSIKSACLGFGGGMILLSPCTISSNLFSGIVRESS